jgi:hypothetical protein
MSRFLSLLQRATVLFPPALVLAGLALLVVAVLTAAASNSTDPFRWPQH